MNRALFCLLLLLLAGCSDSEKSSAPADVMTNDVPEDNATMEATAIAMPEPIIVEAELVLNCHIHSQLVWSRYCPTGTSSPLEPSDYTVAVPVTGIEVVVIEAEITKGNPAQILARGESPQEWFYREPIQDTLRIQLTRDNWGGLSEVNVDLAGPELYKVAGMEVWGAYDVVADVAISTFEIAPANIDDYCVRC